MIEFMIVLGMVAGLLGLYMLLAWWGCKCLKGWEALSFAGLTVLMLAVLVTNPSVAVKMIALLLIFSPYLFVHIITNPGSSKKFYAEEVAKYRAAVDLHPDNWGTRELLAESLYKMGDLDTAIAEQQLAVRMNPNADRQKYILKLWEEEKQEKETGIAVCPHCGTENPEGRNWCKRCEHKIIRFQEKSWLSQLGVNGILMIFGSMIVIVFSFAVLGTWGWIPVICLALALIGWKMAGGRSI